MGDTDLNIKPVSAFGGNMNEFSVQKLIPAHLLTLVGNKKELYFVSVKTDYHQAFIQSVGFFYTGDLETLFKSHTQVVQQAQQTPEIFVEMQFPWDKVISNRSLVYRHKVKQQ